MRQSVPVSGRASTPQGRVRTTTRPRTRTASAGPERRTGAARDTFVVARVDPNDDSIERWSVRWYRYDPDRHERRHVTVAAFDNASEYYECMFVSWLE